jgi:hypothetical protein
MIGGVMTTCKKEEVLIQSVVLRLRLLKRSIGRINNGRYQFDEVTDALAALDTVIKDIEEFDEISSKWPDDIPSAPRRAFLKSVS